MVKTMTYGVLSSISTMEKTAGKPFGNPYSYADGTATNSTGILYFYVSDLDQSMKDFEANNAASFTLTEAEVWAIPSHRSQPSPTPCHRADPNPTPLPTLSPSLATAWTRATTRRTRRAPAASSAVTSRSSRTRMRSPSRRKASSRSTRKCVLGPSPTISISARSCRPPSG
mmetsp:Transcript_29136/g.93232  ORF Transcript_29136/g.93232 Transcript_29136/m.93232 type:complete len:171 (-) Transcript_29136:163-675(-)